MLAFEHENLPKTRRTILIVCVLIITLENYLLPGTSKIGFSNFNFEISKDDITNGFCIALLYLWLVLLAQFFTGPYRTLLDRNYEQEKADISDAFRGPNESPDQYDHWHDDAEIHAHHKAKRHYKRRKQLTNLYSQLVFSLPAIVLTAFVWIKFDGLMRVFPAIWGFIVT